MDERRRKQMEYHQALDAQVRERRLQEEMNKTQRRPTNNQALPPMVPNKQNAKAPQVQHQPYPQSNADNSYLPQVPNTDNAELVRLSEEMKMDKGKYESVMRAHQRESENISSLKDRIYALEAVTSDLRAGKEASELRNRMVEEQRGDAANNFKNELNELRHELAMEREARKQEAHRFMNELELVKNDSLEKLRFTNEKYNNLEEELRREKERSILLEERVMSRVSASEELISKVSRGASDGQHLNGRIEALEIGVRKIRDQHKQDVTDIAKSVATTRTQLESQVVDNWKKVKSYTEAKFLSERQQTEAKLISLMNENEVKFNKKLSSVHDEAVEISVSKSKDMLGRDNDSHSYELNKLSNVFEDQVNELKRVLSAEIAARQGRTKQVEKQLVEIKDMNLKMNEKVEIISNKLEDPSSTNALHDLTSPQKEEVPLASFMGQGGSLINNIVSSSSQNSSKQQKKKTLSSKMDSFDQEFDRESDRLFIKDEVKKLFSELENGFGEKLDKHVSDLIEKNKTEQINQLKQLELLSAKKFEEMKDEIKTSIEDIKSSLTVSKLEKNNGENVSENDSKSKELKREGFEEWTSAFDDVGTPYWYNNWTGESTYDDPNGWKDDLIRTCDELKDRMKVIEETRKQDKAKIVSLEADCEAKFSKIATSIAKQAKETKAISAVVTNKGGSVSGTAMNSNANNQVGVSSSVDSLGHVHSPDSDEIEILREEVNQCIKLSEKGLASLDQAKLLILEQSLQIKSDKNTAQDIKNKENKKQIEMLKQSFEIGLMNCSEELAKISSMAINEAKESSKKSEKAAEECEILIDNFTSAKNKELEELKSQVFEFSDSLNEIKASMEAKLVNESNSLKSLMRSLVGAENAERMRSDARNLEDLESKLNAAMKKVELELSFAAKEISEKTAELVENKQMEQLLYSKTNHEKLEKKTSQLRQGIDELSTKQQVSDCLSSLLDQVCDRHINDQVHEMYESIIGIGYGALTGLNHIDIARQEAADYCDEEEQERQEDVKFLAGKIHENEIQNDLLMKKLEKEQKSRDKMKDSLFNDIKHYVSGQFQERQEELIELEQEIIDMEDRLNTRSAVETCLNDMVQTIAFGIGPSVMSKNVRVNSGHVSNLDSASSDSLAHRVEVTKLKVHSAGIPVQPKKQRIIKRNFVSPKHIVGSPAAGGSTWSADTIESSVSADRQSYDEIELFENNLSQDSRSLPTVKEVHESSSLIISKDNTQSGGGNDSISMTLESGEVSNDNQAISIKNETKEEGSEVKSDVSRSLDNKTSSKSQAISSSDGDADERRSIQKKTPVSFRTHKVKMDLASSLGLVVNPGGFVGKVTPNEQGDLLGIEKGNRITRINHTEINSAKDLKTVLQAHKQKGDDYVDLYYEAKVSTAVSALKQVLKAKSKFKNAGNDFDENRYSDEGVLVQNDGPSPTTQDNVEAFNRKKKEIEMAEEESEKSRLKLEADPTVGKVTINIKEPLGMVIGDNGDITELNRGGQAHTIGLKVGMKIHRIHNKDVSSLEDIRFAMSKFKYFNLKEVDLYYSPKAKPFEMRRFMNRISVTNMFGRGSRSTASTLNANDGASPDVAVAAVNSPISAAIGGGFSSLVEGESSGKGGTLKIPNRQIRISTLENDEDSDNIPKSSVDRVLKQEDEHLIKLELNKMSQELKKSANTFSPNKKINSSLSEKRKEREPENVNNPNKESESFDDKMMTIKYENEESFVDLPSPANIPRLSLRASGGGPNNSRISSSMSNKSKDDDNQAHSDGDQEYSSEEGVGKVMLSLQVPLGMVISPKAIITRVFPGEQADKLGLKRGLKITKIGSCVINTYQDIKIALESYKHANEMEVDMWFSINGNKKMGTFKRVMKADLAFNSNRNSKV